MENPKITGVYWIKNESRFIEKSLKSVMDICSETIVMDNNSTDDTVEICSGFDKVKDIIKRKDLPLDEVRDKHILYEHARKTNPDFILAVDGDEIFMPNASEILFEELSTIHPNSDVFELQFLTLWDNVHTIRTDGIFGFSTSKKSIYLEIFFPIKYVQEEIIN